VAFLQSLSLKRDDPRVHANLGTAQRLEGKLDKAIECYGRALSLAPGFARARHQRATANLLLGRSKQGWQELGAGRRDPWPGQAPPPWDGADPGGRSLLLYGDGDLGETLLLLRFLHPLRQRGARVTLVCEPATRRLLQGAGVADRLLEAGQPLPPGIDARAPLRALPLLLDLPDPRDAPGPPYLAPDPELALAPAQLPAPSAGQLRVGFLWKGEPPGPHSEIPLSDWAPLWRLPDTRWFSFQYALQEPEARALAGAPEVTDLGRRLTDVAEALACLSRLDLLLTPGNAVAQLAAAAGLECWVLLPGTPAWCWGARGASSPWYPGARLFRQPAPGSWEPLLEQVRQALDSLLTERAGAP
jgi:hypothetical protein